MAMASISANGTNWRDFSRMCDATDHDGDSEYYRREDGEPVELLKGSLLTVAKDPDEDLVAVH
jgi:hypothetical protein